MSILDEREKTHGDYAHVAQTAQAIKAIFDRTKMSDVQNESIDLIATKLARIACGDPTVIDHWEDLAGYAELVVRDLHANQSLDAVAQAALTATAPYRPRAPFKPIAPLAVSPEQVPLSEILRRADQEPKL